MAKYVTAIRTAEGDKQIDYNALANLPDPLTLPDLGVTATARELNILDGVTATAKELNTLDGITATTKELNYVAGATSNIQMQLDTLSDTAAEHQQDISHLVSHTHTADEVGAVPTSRTVNGKALSDDISLTASDVGAAISDHNHNLIECMGTLSVAKGGTGATTAVAARGMLGITPENIGAVPSSRTVNGQTLATDITISFTCTQIMGGSVPVGSSEKFTYEGEGYGYALYIVEGYTINGSSLATVVINGQLPDVTQVTAYQFADEGHFVSFLLYRDNTDLILTNVSGSNSGEITAIYGVK